MDDMITLTKTERQLLLFEIFLRFSGHELQTIQEVLPVERRMLQRDVKDLMDAGLIQVKYVKSRQGYVLLEKSGAFLGDAGKPNRDKHLRRLRRLGILIHKLTNDEIASGEKYVRSQYVSCKEVYEKLFPNESARTMQRDFRTLSRIGYPIKYNRRIKYYEFYDDGIYRTDFGVWREDGKLKRRIGTNDYERQFIPWSDIEAE